ncbi:MAG: hypothetical protein HYY18_23440 [Planctomycetes bacterium]|nr:hypothetical protein [Planctomycetota bacterium]
MKSARLPVLFLAIALPLAAQTGDADRLARAKLEETRMDVNFEGSDFVDAVHLMREFTGLNILIDTRVAEEVQGTTVTLKLSKVRAINALRWLVRQRELEFRIVDGVVLITNREGATGLPELRLYDVADILSAPRDFPAEGTAESMSLSVEDMMDLVKGVVAPDTWDSYPNSIQAAGNTLVVSADPATLAQIERLLGAFRVMAHFTVTFDARVVDLVPQALPGAPTIDALAPGKVLLTRDEAAALLARGGNDVSLVEAARFTCMNGQRTHVRLDREERTARGLQSNEPAAAPFLDTVANDRRTILEVSPILVVGRDQFVVDLTASIADPALTPAVLSTQRGPIHCARASGRQVRTSFRVPNGGACLFVLGTSADRVRALLVRTSSTSPASSTSTPIAELQPKDDLAEAAFREFLNRKVVFDFNGTKFADVVAYLRDVTGMNCVIDPSLVAEGCDQEWLVTLKIKDLDMKAALGLLTGMFEITCVLRDEAAVFTRTGRAETARVEVYDVRDLLRGRSDWPGPRQESATTWPVQEEAREPFSAYDPDSLEDLIRGTIAPGTWDGTLTHVFNGMLIVRHNPSVHSALAGFLDRLREAKPLQIHVDARILEVEAALHDTLDAGGDGPLPESSRSTLERAIREGRARVTAQWSILGLNAQRFHALQSATRAYVAGYESSSGFATPRYDMLHGAHILDVRPTLIPNEPGQILVDVRVTACDLPSELATASAGLSPVELPSASRGQVATMVFTKSGDTRLISLGNVTRGKTEVRRVVVWTVRIIE